MDVKKIIKLIENKKFVYICGNGGAGKTSCAKEIKKQLEIDNKTVNLISTDDFITNKDVRNNTNIKWTLDGKEFSGRCTSCCKEAYFWSALDAILFSLQNGLDCFYKPKRENIVRLFANADYTIIEGIGTAFLRGGDNSVALWFECSKETEIQRRMKRGDLLRKDVEARLETRDLQFEANVLPNKQSFDYEINTENENIEIKEIKD